MITPNKNNSLINLIDKGKEKFDEHNKNHHKPNDGIKFIKPLLNNNKRLVVR